MNELHLLKLASAFALHRELSLSTVSTYAANDGKFFRRLSSGSGCTVRRAAALLKWFDRHWPEDLEWPSDIPRPSRTKETTS